MQSVSVEEEPSAKRLSWVETHVIPTDLLEIIVHNFSAYDFFRWVNSIIFTYNLETMYSLKCNYYEKEFATIDELLRDVLDSGMDPNFEITFDGKPTGETAWDLIEPQV